MIYFYGGGVGLFYLYGGGVGLFYLHYVFLIKTVPLLFINQHNSITEVEYKEIYSKSIHRQSVQVPHGGRLWTLFLTGQVFLHVNLVGHMNMVMRQHPYTL